MLTSDFSLKVLVACLTQDLLWVFCAYSVVALLYLADECGESGGLVESRGLDASLDQVFLELSVEVESVGKEGGGREGGKKGGE